MTAPNFVAATAANGTGTGTGSIAVPSGTIDNDLMILVIGFNILTPTITSGLAAWTLGSGPDNSPSGGSAANRTYWYWKIASGEPANYTPVASASSTRRYVMSTWRGNHATPFDATSSPLGFAGTSVTSDDVTTTGVDRLLIFIVNAEATGSVGIWDAVSGMTQNSNTASGGQAVSIYSEPVGVGTFTRTATHSFGSALDGMSYLLAVAPASVGGGPTSQSLAAPTWFG